jgi:intracellular sulfur oxidation DsrE/DsrF family protein
MTRGRTARDRHEEETMIAFVRTLTRLRNLFAAAMLVGCATFASAAEPISVVYHLNEGLAQAQRAIGNIRNHLNAEPSTKIVVVTHGKGIDFLLEGAKNDKGQEFEAAVADLVGRGVQFRVCNNTLVGRDIPKEKVIMEAKIVPSGVAEVARLQAQEHFVYLRP